MSTFLEDGNILIRSRRRFMVFTKEGFFKDEITFNDNAEEVDGDDDNEVTIEDLRAQMPSA